MLWVSLFSIFSTSGREQWQQQNCRHNSRRRQTLQGTGRRQRSISPLGQAFDFFFFAFLSFLYFLLSFSFPKV